MTPAVAADPFTEEWFGEASCEALANLYNLVADLEGDIIEIGSWEGRSTVALANACHPATLHAVDTFEGSPGEVSAELATSRLLTKQNVHATFQRNVADLTEGNVEAHRMGWREWFKETDTPLRFVFIDAEHSEIEVRENIEAALTRMVPGGIICGDDAHHPPVQKAVLDTLGDAMRVATLWYHQVPASPLEGRYRRLCATPSDIWEHLPTFVEMVTSRESQHVIELGTRTGVSTIAWLHGLAQTGGRLTSVDIDARPDIGDYPHWWFVQGSDLDPAVFSQLDEADIVFIDTSHAWLATLRELNLYRHLVKPGGLIVCHDTELARPETAQPGEPLFPVKRAIEEFCEAEGLTWTNDPRCWGLAQIEVP